MHVSAFRFLILLLLLSLLSLSAYSQQIQPGNIIELDEGDHAKICVLHPTEINAHYKYAPDHFRQKGISSAAATATFVIDYKNDCNAEVWPEQAQTAFEYAVSIWESHLDSPIPIKIEANWVALNENVLGSAGPTSLIGDFGGSLPNTWYSIAQASAIAGTDFVNEFDQFEYDIIVNMNCEFPNWYLETDANPPAGTLDAVTVLLHEIGHGIGFTGSMSGDPNTRVADWGIQGNPIIFDRFTLEGSFRQLIDENIFPHPSGDLFDALIGREGGVYFSGTDAEFANGNLRVPLYSPESYAPGSSYSHFDQQYFSNTPNALMRPQLDQALAVHSPGPVFCGLLSDMQWPLGQACIDLLPAEEFLERPELSSPFNGTGDNSVNPILAWNSVEGAAEYRIQLSRNFLFTDLVTDETVSDNSFTVNEVLEFNTLYFWRVQAISPGGNSHFSGKFRFTTATKPPESIILITPDNGTTQLRPGFGLAWQEDNRAEEYEIEIAKNEDFSPVTFNRTVTVPSFGATQNFDFSTTYYWRVRGVNAAGPGDWSQVRSFTTIIEKPESVTLNSPTDNQNQVPVNTVFTWLESVRAFEYVIQVSEDESFSSETVVELNSTEETVTVNNSLGYATIYFWRVKATNIGGESEWSEPKQFTTVVQETAIMPNYPNPFNATTTIRFQLASANDVTLDVFDSAGRRIAVLVAEERQAGVYFEQLQAAGYASGTYFIRIVAGDFMDVQKMALIK